MWKLILSWVGEEPVPEEAWVFGGMDRGFEVQTSLPAIISQMIRHHDPQKQVSGLSQAIEQHPVSGERDPPRSPQTVPSMMSLPELSYWAPPAPWPLARGSPVHPQLPAPCSQGRAAGCEDSGFWSPWTTQLPLSPWDTTNP